MGQLQQADRARGGEYCRAGAAQAYGYIGKVFTICGGEQQGQRIAGHGAAHGSGFVQPNAAAAVLHDTGTLHGRRLLCLHGVAGQAYRHEGNARQ
ncbi:hypothetical protein D3C72_1985110 [compost metagenome]